MKNKLMYFLVVCVFFIGIYIGLNIYNQYDVNRDGKVNAQDYVIIKNYIINNELEGLICQ